MEAASLKQKFLNKIFYSMLLCKPDKIIVLVPTDLNSQDWL